MSNDPCAVPSSHRHAALKTRSGSRALGGFSLIEVMIAAALLGLIGAGVLTSITFAQQEAARTRARTYASSDAQTVIDRMLVLSGVARAAGAAGGDTTTVLCNLFKAAGGPMDVSGGGTLTVNSCLTTPGPSLTATNIPLTRSSLRRTVSVVPETLGIKPGLRITVRVSGGQLPPPGFIQIESHVTR